MPDTDIVIVGGGAAGLSTAAALKRRGLDAIVLDRLPRIGDVWARRYDRLHLHTAFSSLAHYPMPRRYPRYPSKDQYAQYLREYARHFKLDIVAGCTVDQVRMESSPTSRSECEGTHPTWLVASSCGAWHCRVVVLATGQNDIPVTPSWLGMEAYQGALTHSAAYKTGRPYAGQRVLVIGVGNSGAEIATDLSEQGAAFVAISIRTPPPIVARDPFGQPAQRSSLVLSRLPPALADRIAHTLTRLVMGDLTRYGLAEPAWWPYSAQNTPVIDVGFVAAVKRGQVHIRPNVVSFTPDGVVYADGRAETFDAVIAATGYKTALDQLLDAPGAFDGRGEPAFASGQPTSYPGLYFIGYGRSLRGLLFEANRDSRRLAKMIAGYLH